MSKPGGSSSTTPAPALKGAGASGRRGASLARYGALWAIVVLVLDQASKLWLMYGADIASRPPIVVTPFLEFVLVWNRGVSYGLFQMSHEAGRWGLVVVSLLATIFLCVWLRRAKSRMLALGLGLIIGGAIGNVIDRVWWGAVVDFVHFHVGTFSWYVFNIADAAIVAGVIALLYDSFTGSDGEKAASDA